MIKDKDLDLIVCHACKQEFKHKSSIFTVSAGIYCDFSAKVEPEKKNINTQDRYPLTIKRQLHFHESCWEDIAGTEYMP